MPRKAGMERAELLSINGKIFIGQGKALDAVASRGVKALVVGNPANTNAWIAMKSAPGLPRENFTAMLRLDHNRALSQLAAKTGKPVASIQKLAVWGNHSPTMYADYRFATIEGAGVKDMINDHGWNKDVFLPTVGKRGAAIIEARGLSSAASAANAAIDHMRDWALGTGGSWVTVSYTHLDVYKRQLVTGAWMEFIALRQAYAELGCARRASKLSSGHCGSGGKACGRGRAAARRDGRHR